MPASFISNKERIFLFTEFKFWFSINKSMMELDFGRNLENILKMFRQKADLKIYTGSRQRMKEHCFVVHVYIPDNKKWLVSLQNVNKVKSILLAHASLFHVCADYQICRFVKKTNSLAYTQSLFASKRQSKMKLKCNIHLWFLLSTNESLQSLQL